MECHNHVRDMFVHVTFHCPIYLFMLLLELESKYYMPWFVLFVLRFNVPVNNFSVMSGWSHHFLGIYQYFRGVTCLAQGDNMAEVGFEPPTSPSEV